MTEEIIDLIEENAAPIVNEMEIEITESIGWAAADTNMHSNLPDRNAPNQHLTSAITGLDEQLAQIKAPRVLYSNKSGVAHYYEWASGAYDEAGYFVSLVPGSSKIKICDGINIFGVTVEEAGFVGNQGTTGLRGNNYGLVATSGLVDVRCVSGINEGDYVVANASGLAEKTDSDCGYKVVSKATKDGTEYVSISLGVQACTTNLLGQRVGRLEVDLDAAELNIQAAMKLANDATAMAGASNITSNEAQDKINGVIDATNNALKDVNNSLKDIDEAKQAAKDAAYQADVVAKQAVDRANDALAKANAVEQDNQYILSRTEETAENYERLIGSIDKYSIGECSQSYGLTLEQARSILKPGMIYIPTESHKEIYWATIDGKGYSFEKEFTDGYYYRWHSRPFELTIDNGTKDISGYWWSEQIYGVWPSPIMLHGTSCAFWYDNSTLYNLETADWAKFNKSIWVESEAPTDAQYDYWFNNNVVESKSIDLTSGTETWMPYDTYIGETSPTENSYEFWYDGTSFYTHWFEVNTIVGNASNRISSMIRQDVDAITAEIVNAHGGVAGFGAWLTDTEAKANIGTFWADPASGEKNMANIGLVANDDGSSMSFVVRKTTKNDNGELESEDVVVSGAGITLNQNEEGSSILIEADCILIEGESIFKTENGQTFIDGGLIETGSIQADDITTGTLKSDGYIDGEVYSQTGTSFSLDNGTIKSQKFAVDEIGVLHARGADIEGTINATDGKIGQFTIKDGYMNLMVSGGGNLMDTILPPSGDRFTLDDYMRVYSFADAVDDAWKGYLEQGKTYTVVIDMMIDWNSEISTMNPSDVIRLYTAVSAREGMSSESNGVDLGCLTIQDTNQWQTVKYTFQFDYGDRFTTEDEYVAYLNEESGRKGLAIAPNPPMNATDCPINNLTIYDIKLFEGETTNEEGLVTSSHISDTMSWSITPDQCVWWNQDTTRQDPLMRLDKGGLYVRGEIESQLGYIGNISIQESGLCGHVDNVPSWILNNEGLYMPTSGSMLQVGNFSLYNIENTEGSLTTYFKSNGSFKIQASSGAYIALDDQTGNEPQEIRVKLYYACSVGGRANTYIYAQADKAPYYDLTVQVECKRYDINADSGNEYNVQTNTVVLTIKANEEQSDEQLVFGTASPYFAVHNTTTNQWNTAQPKYDGVYQQMNYYSKTYVQNRSATDIKIQGNLIPSEKGNYNLGLSDCYWNVIYSKDGTVSVSDGKKKNTVQSLEDSYDLIFDSLKPVSYKFNENTSNRTHVGFVAQDVKDAVEFSGLTTQDFAGYCEWEESDGEIGCGLRYGEFVSLNTWQIQKLKSRVSELEAKLKELAEKNN